jgi:hypothetical protein
MMRRPSPTDRPALGRLLPHVMLQSSHPRDITGVARPTSSPDPLLPIVTGSYRESN